MRAKLEFCCWLGLSLTAFLFCACFCLAQAASSSQSTVIEGRVVNSITGDPVRQAQVALHHADAPSETPAIAITDATGRFALKNLKPGKYSLDATHSGFLDNSSIGAPVAQQSSMMLLLTAGQRLKGILLKLTPPGVIAGRILGEDGDPLPNSVAMAISSASPAGENRSAVVNRVYANDLGEYRLYGLPPGRYYVSATYRNGRKVYTQTYYPKAPTLAAAAPLELAPGAILTAIDITLSRKETPSLSRVEQSGDAGAKAALEGQVVNAADSDPVRKAEVALYAEGKGSDPIDVAITDASGYFTFNNIEPGSYRLDASRNGFMSAEHVARHSQRSATSISLAANQTIKGIRLELIPQGTIAGRVLGEDHDPLPNVVVMALRLEGGKRPLALATRVYTNDLGEYRLYGLRPGRYYLSAVYSGDRSSSSGVLRPVEATSELDVTKEAYAPTDYPNALSIADAEPLRMMPGGFLAGMDFELCKTHKVQDRGRVHVPGAKADRNLRVSLIPRDSSIVARFIPRQTLTIQPATGEFEIRDVTPGAYVLTADWSDGTQQYWARKPIDIDGADINGLTLTLTPPLQVSGQLRVEGQNNLDLSALGVSLHSSEQEAVASGGRGTVAPNGTFTIANLRPEHYAVSVAGLKEDYYLKSVHLGTAELSPSDVDLSHGAGGIFELVASSAGGKIEGVVLDDKQQPAAATTVVLIPESAAPERNELYKKVGTDQNGRFTLRGIPPGNYKLVASEDIEPDLYRDPAVMASLEKLGKAVTVYENSTETLQLSLVPASQSKEGLWAP